MSHIARLLQVQDLDSELDTHRARLQAIERALQDSPAVRTARQQLVNTEGQLQQARAAVQAVEHDLQALAAKKAEAEKQTYGGHVTNPRQLQDLQRELESFQRRRIALEEIQLEALIKVESAEVTFQSVQAALQLAEQEAAKTQGELLAERNRRKGEMEKLEARREGAWELVPATQRTLYETLRVSKKGRAVVRLTEGSCAACGEELSSALAQTVRQGQQVVPCPSCGRILCMA